MPSYLLTWKPKRWDWISLEDEIRELRTEGRLRLRWSAGVNRHINKGDRVFLFRQGLDRPGIIGAGHVLKGSYVARHWDPRRHGSTIFVDVRMDSLLHPEQDHILSRDDLNFGPPRLWISQSSGVTIPNEAALELERRWSSHLKRLKRAPMLLAQELLDARGLPEGAKERISVKSVRARQA
jgi:hypothetical protein